MAIPGPHCDLTRSLEASTTPTRSAGCGPPCGLYYDVSLFQLDVHDRIESHRVIGQRANGARSGSVTPIQISLLAVANNIQGHYIIAMKARRWDRTLYELAEGQAGYFTAAQARIAGLHPVRLVQLENTEDIERLSRGVYRLARYPISPYGQYMEAALWPQVRRPEIRGTISHESALAMYGLSDVSPAKIHITLPSGLRIRRAPPEHLVIHHADLDPTDVQVVEGIPVTTAERAIRDVHAAHLGDALVRQAIEDGRRTGYLSVDQAKQLKRELLGRKQS